MTQRHLALSSASRHCPARVTEFAHLACLAAFGREDGTGPEARSRRWRVPGRLAGLGYRGAAVTRKPGLPPTRQAQEGKPTTDNSNKRLAAELLAGAPASLVEDPH